MLYDKKKYYGNYTRCNSESNDRFAKLKLIGLLNDVID